MHFAFLRTFDRLALVLEVSSKQVEQSILDRFGHPGALTIEDMSQERCAKMAVEIGMVPAVLVRAQAGVAGGRTFTVLQQVQRKLEQLSRFARSCADESCAARCGVVQEYLNFTAARATFV